MSDQELLELKGRGHQLLKLLSDLNNKGDQNRVYRRLARAMGVPRSEAHFSKMSEEQVKQAVRLLQAWVTESLPKPKTRKGMEKSKRKKELAIIRQANAAKPYQHIKDAIAALPKNPPLSLRKKVSLKIRSLFNA